MSVQNFHPSSSDYGSDIDIDIDIDFDLGIPIDIDLSFPEAATVNSESNYGSDIDLADEALLHLLDYPPPSPPLYPLLPALDDLAQDFTPAASPPKFAKPIVKTRTRFARDGTLVIEYEELVQSVITPPEPPAEVLPIVSEAQPEAEAADTLPPPNDIRSPYERFRSRRGRLSVTDLVSGVWCEQQFQYTLERGFKRTTPAMAKGTKLHKVLESQVHTTVPVETVIPEDSFGLQLFNICQGLLSLEEQGVARELDVFGYIDGVFIQGVIDEVTYLNPDPTLAPSLSTTTTPTSSQSSPTLSQPNFFLPDPDAARVAYITDTKTRSSKSLPRGSQLRATALQLMLYHRLLSLLPSVPFAKILEQRGLDGGIQLSDRFVAQIVSMPCAITFEDFLLNNSLNGLWTLVLRQLERSIPTVGDTVGVVYRAQSDGRVMARQAWGVDGEELEKHLKGTLMWWRGERGSVGVQVEDAWKCRMCEFEESCTWRLGQLERLAGERRGKRASGGKIDEGKSDEGTTSDEEKGKGKGKRKGRGVVEEAKTTVEKEEKEKKPRARSKRKATPGSDTELGPEKVAKATDTERGRSKSKKDNGTAA